MTRSHINIASRERNESITIKTWCQIVSFRESVLCNHITSRSCKARIRSRRTNNIENIWSFRILIDLILWQNLIKVEKLVFAFFASMHASRIRCTSFSYRFFDLFLFASHRWHILWTFYSQIAQISNHWCCKKYLRILRFTMMLSNHDVICTLVNIALLKQKVFVLWCIFYSILDINFHIDVSFYEEHLEIQNVFNRSIARLTIRSYVIFEVNRSSNFDSFVFAIFASMHDLILESITFKEFARKLQTIHRWENFRTHRFKRARIYIVEKACTKASDWTR